MAYAPDKSAPFVGVERIKGTVGGKNGSIVLLHDGQLTGRRRHRTLRVASGTDGLTDVAGAEKFAPIRRLDDAGPRRRLGASGGKPRWPPDPTVAG